MESNRYILIGTVVGVHGVKGVIKITSYAESIESFQVFRELYFQKDKNEKRLLEIEWVKPYKNSLLLALKDINDRNDAEILVGGNLFIDRNLLPELEEGSYYWADLINLSVFSVHGEYLGILESIFRTGSNDVYVIRNHDTERLIPAIASVIVSVDIKAGMMHVNLPEGL